MVVIHEREVSNAHGTGVLLNNIINTIGDKDNIVLCRERLHTSVDIKHFFLDDLEIYQGSRMVRRLLLTKVGTALYFAFKKPALSKIKIEKHQTVLITIYTFDLLWRTLKFMRLFPKKRYILFMMDNFIDFTDKQEGTLNKKAFQLICKNAEKRLAISKILSKDLEKMFGSKFNVFYGPRELDWDKIRMYHNQKKENRICFVGNAWVEDVLPVIDNQLQEMNVKIHWFVGAEKFAELKTKYNLTNFIFGGSFSSEEVIAQVASFRYGLILYGLKNSAENYFNKKLQEYSIPSKIIDYCCAGIEPLYYGPDNTACYDFLVKKKIGVLVNNNTFISFLKVFKEMADRPIDFEKMKLISQECSTENFKGLINSN